MTLFHDLVEAQATDGEDVAMTFVYYRILELRQWKRYEEIETFIQELIGKTAQFAPVVHLAILTITAPIQDKLPSRVAYRSQVKARLTPEQMVGL